MDRYQKIRSATKEERVDIVKGRPHATPTHSLVLLKFVFDQHRNNSVSTILTHAEIKCHDASVLASHV